MNLGACLINVGPGALVDEAALAAALREQKIGGAARSMCFPRSLWRSTRRCGRAQSADYSAHGGPDR